MARSQVVTVGPAATRLPTTPLQRRTKVLVENISDTTLYVTYDSTVTSADVGNTYVMATGTRFLFRCSDVLYACTLAGTEPMLVTEME